MSWLISNAGVGIVCHKKIAYVLNTASFIKLFIQSVNSCEKILAQKYTNQLQATPGPDFFWIEFFRKGQNRLSFSCDLSAHHNCNAWLSFLVGPSRYTGQEWCHDGNKMKDAVPNFLF